MPQSSSSPVSSGGRAIRRGRILERYVRELLDEEHEKVSATRLFVMGSLRQPLFAQPVDTGAGVYGRRRLVDFVHYYPQR